jgi:nucleoprotein TPR
MSELDISHIASTYSLPHSTLQTLLDAPTSQLVQALFQSLSAFAKSHDDLKADKLKADVELEAAVRSGDAKVRQLKGSLETSLKEIETLRRSLNESGMC